MSELPTPGRSLVTRRAVADIIRAAVRTSYGVTGMDAGPLDLLLGALHVREPGIRIRLRPGFEVDLALTVGSGLPIAEVARQVDSSVRYAVRVATGHEIDRLTIHVGGLRYQPASQPPIRDAGAAPDDAGPVVGQPPADAA